MRENIPMSSKDLCMALLAKAEIPLNRSKKYGIEVYNEKLWDRIISKRQLGLAEGYMDGWWDCDAIDEFLTRLLEINVLENMKPSPTLFFHWAKSTFLNRQTKSKADKNAKYHYNIGNDLYSRMLDKEMIYSCAYWKRAKSLDQAQLDKLDLICRKLDLKPGMKILDIGSGWGALLRYAAKNYGIIGMGISPADAQVNYANSKVGKLKIEYRQMDYRDLTGNFDRIISVGMMEHVGPKNLATFFDKCDELLKSDGLMLHHTISSNYSKLVTDPFFDKYIFPGGVLPSIGQIAHASEKKFIIEDIHNFGPDYDKTLMQWHKNINKKWSEIPNYDDRFKRMWNYYLLASAAGFRTRNLQLLQVVFSRGTLKKPYTSIR